MINITIKGGCTSREPFNYQMKLFDKKIFNISNYIFHKHIAVLESRRINIKQDIIDEMKLGLINKETVQDFVVKQVNNSFTKNFFRENDKEANGYFIMDFLSERKKVIEVDGSFIEYRSEFINELRNSKIDFEVKVNAKELFFEYIDKFIATLKSRYSEENIVLHKAYAVNITKLGDIDIPLTSTFANPLNKKRINAYSIKRVAKLNLLLMELYEYVETNYPNISVLELPIRKYHSPLNHKYGRGIFHYNDEYYFDFLKRLEKLLGYKKDKDIEIAKENKRHIEEQYQVQKVISNIYRSNFSFNRLGNPEDLLFGPLRSTIKYRVNSEGLPLVKSYLLKDSSPGLIIYGDRNELMGKLVFNKNNKLKHIYTLYKGKKVKTISYIGDKNEVKTELFNVHQKKVSESGNSTLNNEGKNIVYSFFDDTKQIVIKLIINKLNQKRIIFYKNNQISRIIELHHDRLSKLLKYSDGVVYEEFRMGEYINLGKVQIKVKYNKNKKRARYIYYASGDLQSKSIFSLNGRYLKTEYFNKGEVTKKIFYDPDNGKKSQVIHFQASETKVIDYFNSGERKAISIFDSNGNMVRKVSRNNIDEFFYPVEAPDLLTV